MLRAARLGLPMALAIIGGDPVRFTPFAEGYRVALQEYGRSPLPLSIHSPGHVAETAEQAIEEFWPPYQEMFGRIGRERGWPPRTHEQFLTEVGAGALCVGGPDEVAAKMARTITALGAQRFDLKYSNGSLPHPSLLRSIELYATEVVPRVRTAARRIAADPVPPTVPASARLASGSSHLGGPLV